LSGQATTRFVRSRQLSQQVLEKRRLA